MIKDEPKKSKFAPSNYSYKKETPSIKVVAIGLFILLTSGILASYAQRGVDNSNKPSMFGFTVMIVVAVLSAYAIEKIIRHYFPDILKSKPKRKKLSEVGKKALGEYLEKAGYPHKK